MALKHETEALVVGAGPVGMFAALGLARRGIGVELIEEEWRQAARSYALDLHPSFGRDGVWLAGDAAHLAPPVALQSMNLGLEEAWELADRGARVAPGPEFSRSAGGVRAGAARYVAAGARR